jgi:Fic family protein
MTEQSLWQAIKHELETYNSLRLNEVVDYERFYLYSIITHSTAIEGSTLTESETHLLFDEGLTAKGKPLVHHLMNEDLKNAYNFALDKAKEKMPITVQFLQELNAHVMKSTGGLMNTMGGIFDSSKGDFRLCNVTAGHGGSTYLNYAKIPEKIAEFLLYLQQKLLHSSALEDLYNASFDAHLNLATIHPWVDGNGRTARLLMNYIQFCNHLVPVKVYTEDKADYIASLVDCQKQETSEPFRLFMAGQFLKILREENGCYG